MRLAFAVLLVFFAPVLAEEEAPADGGESLAGSRSCRECHERFYELWAPSHHGKAMQPYSPAVGLPESTTPLRIGDRAYRFEIREGEGVVVEGERAYPVAHVMGGKNVYFLLTPLERGRLQVLPIAYDVRAKEWYDTTSSMVRHAAGRDDAPVGWRDPLLTFNTSCWSCHVSQLDVNYDLESDTYDSRWAEPGINCEACHGPATEHVRVCREAAAAGREPDDLAIERLGTYTDDQLNDACSTCHAKASPISSDFEPGDRFFDHFDLVTLEDHDFHPDGRDLGENYTFTLWRMSPCVQAGELNCVHCHTSSGRYRFHGENAACLPCHAEHVNDAPAHTHHPDGSEGNLCVSCHMPMTTFARMQRSDHSMRAPAPALTSAYGSPNACNLCHDEKDAAWADERVRAWRERDYQAPMLRRAELIAKARARDWSDLDAMLEAIAGDDRDEIHANSLIRLLAACPDGRKLPVLVRATKDASALVRASAAAALEPHLMLPEAARALVDLVDDDLRLVRIRAAAALAGLPAGNLPPEAREALSRATRELVDSFRSRPDQWHAHFNLGNLHQRRGESERALEAFATAVRLRPDAVPPRVNAAMVHARAGSLDEAERMLRDALGHESDHPEAHYNLGLLLAETDRREAAKRHLEAAFRGDPGLSRAALNRAVLAAEERDLDGALAWSRKAVRADAFDARAASTHAYYLAQAGRAKDATRVLEEALTAGAVSPDIYDLLGRLQAEPAAARAVWVRARDDVRLDPRARRMFAARVR